LQQVYSKLQEKHAEMKIDFHKELTVLRSQMTMAQVPDPSSTLSFKPKDANVTPVLDVRFLSVSDGLDEGACKLYNARLQEVCESYKSQMKTLGQTNYMQDLRLRVFEKQLKANTMTSEELMAFAFMKEAEAGLAGELNIWKVCK